jgi:formylglycine-generating enzyme required for sulfatase activity
MRKYSMILLFFFASQFICFQYYASHKGISIKTKFEKSIGIQAGNRALVKQLSQSEEREPSIEKWNPNGAYVGINHHELKIMDEEKYRLEVNKEGIENYSEAVLVQSCEKASFYLRLGAVKKGSPDSSIKNWRDPVIGMEFVWVPGGCYEMGSNEGDSDEKPVHEVCVDGFWVGKYEVNQGEWQRIMGNNPSRFKKGDHYPVEKVSWNDIKEFIRKLNSFQSNRLRFRLPTEAEWEYACRSGGKQEEFSGGNDVDGVAWYGSNSGYMTHPVGTKSANGLGIYDMSGNVWEWCKDIYSENAYMQHQKNNPIYTVGGSYRVIRGGSWVSKPKSVRCANRYISHPSDGFDDIGFRLVGTN